MSVLAYNLGNLWRRLVLPQTIDNWSLTSLQQRLVKTGGRLVLLAAAGRGASDTAGVRGDSAEDLGAAVAGGVAPAAAEKIAQKGGFGRRGV